MKINYKKIYEVSFYIFAFTLPLARVSLSFFSIFFILLWLIEGNFKEKFQKIKQSKVMITLLLFIAWIYLSYFWSEDSDMAIEKVLKYRYLFLPIIIYTSLSYKSFNKLISFFLFGMFISEIVAYGVYFHLWEYKNTSVYDISPFMVHMEYSVFLALSSILLLNRVLTDSYSFKEKVIYFIFFLTVTGNLFLQTGRTGQVAYIFALVALMILRYRFTVKSFLIGVLIIGTIFGTSYQVSHSFKSRTNQTINSVKRMINQKNYRTSLGVRISYWIVTYNILVHRPDVFLVGDGVGDYKLAIKKEINEHKTLYDKKHYKISFLDKHHPHNQHLTNFLQGGVVAFVLFIMIFYFLITRKGFKSKEQKDLAILFSVIYIVGSIGEPLLLKQFTLALGAFFLGILSL